MATVRLALCVCGVLLGWAASVTAADYTSMYDDAALRRAQATYGANLQGMWREDLIGKLPADQRAALSDVTLENPPVGANRHPFDFYAEAQHRRITIPALSVKFFDDLSIATAWFDRRGCSQEAIADYVGMLRYGKFEGQFPAPLQALRVPDDALKDPVVDDVSQKMLKSAFYFWAGHEAAHVWLRHRGYTGLSAREAQEQEKQADRFALEAMRRIGLPPMGMVWYFTYFSRFESAPGDFRSRDDFENYVLKTTTHPLTSDRLLAMAGYIAEHAADFARAQSNPPAWVGTIRTIASQIEQIGRILDDRNIRDLQRSRSQSLTLADIATACAR